MRTHPSTSQLVPTVGADGEVLTVVAGSAAWAAAGGGFPETPTTGDLVVFDGADWVSIGIGSAADVLTVSGGQPAWVAPAAGYSPTLAEKVGALAIGGCPAYAATTTRQGWGAHLTTAADVGALGTSTQTADIGQSIEYRTAGGSPRALLYGSRTQGSGANPAVTSAIVISDATKTSVRIGIALEFTGTATTHAFHNSDTPGETYSVAGAGVFFSDDAGDTNWHVVTSNGTTTTRTDMGVAFDRDVAWAVTVAVNSGTSVVAEVVNLSTGTATKATVTTNAPTSTTSECQGHVGLRSTSTRYVRVGEFNFAQNPGGVWS